MFGWVMVVLSRNISEKSGKNEFKSASLQCSSGWLAPFSKESHYWDKLCNFFVCEILA